MCEGLTFTNMQDAMARARGMSRRRPLVAYRCSSCGRYHIRNATPDRHHRYDRKRRLEELSLLERMEIA